MSFRNLYGVLETVKRELLTGNPDKVSTSSLSHPRDELGPWFRLHKRYGTQGGGRTTWFPTSGLASPRPTATSSGVARLSSRFPTVSGTLVDLVSLQWKSIDESELIFVP